MTLDRAAAAALFDRHLFLSNAGTETYLVFQQGFELPEFCGFVAVENEEAWRQLCREHLEPILDTARASSCGLMLDIMAWRAQPDFLVRLGRSANELGTLNARLVTAARELIDDWRKNRGASATETPILVTADVGPRGDGYVLDGEVASASEALDYHRPQIEALAGAGVDLVAALTMTSAAESIGLVKAAAEQGLPILVSPTVETDGRLPDGSTLGDFIAEVDRQADVPPLFYMVNCAHPSHLRPTLDRARAEGAAWLDRFRGFRANASAKSHAELDESTTLDRGDPAGLADALADMRETYALRVIGGCCGTDHEHLRDIARAATATAPPRASEA